MLLQASVKDHHVSAFVVERYCGDGKSGRCANFFDDIAIRFLEGPRRENDIGEPVKRREFPIAAFERRPASSAPCEVARNDEDGGQRARSVHHWSDGERDINSPSVPGIADSFEPNGTLSLARPSQDVPEFGPVPRRHEEGKVLSPYLGRLVSKQLLCSRIPAADSPPGCQADYCIV